MLAMKTKPLLLLVMTGCLPITAAAEIPWPEHPRPDFKREPWVNLNGVWDFAFDPDDAGEPYGWFLPGRHSFDRKIVVPFPWESRLSGIGETEYKGVAWYSREVTLPDGDEWKGKDAWLVIGACDFGVKVWVNGRLAGEHVGGYVPFDVNLSGFAGPGERVTVTIRAVDPTDPKQPTGKQIRWYTCTSGIWQTVYIEPRGKTYIQSLRALPNIAEGAITYEVTMTGGRFAHLALRSPSGAFDAVRVKKPAGSDAVRATVKVQNPKLWSPDSPTLYPIHVELTDAQGNGVDRVASYFGLREISIGKAPSGDYQYIYLNGKPIYLRGALHQSFHPDGIYQYPGDTGMRSDYELCKRIGLNFLRIHIKVPVPRELYWADKLGVLIMEDMPNFWEHSDQARTWWRAMMRAAIERDFNHPAVFAWCLFNETWGFREGGYDADRRKWVTDMYHLAKRLDPTRLVEENSPCRYDHVVTDINSWHFYINDYNKARKHIREVVDKTYPGSAFNYAEGYKQTDAPLINSEYGGIGAGSGDQDISWCFKYLTNELRLHGKIGGYVYTELSDIEWEHNGFVNYDRSPKAFGYDFWHPGFSLADLNSSDFVAIDAPPMVELAPDQNREIPIKVSHFSDRRSRNVTLRWRVDWLDALGKRHESDWQEQAAIWKPYQVVDQPPIKVRGAGRGMLGALLVELLDGEAVIGRNYVNLLVDRDKLARVEALDAKRVALRWLPGDFSEWTFAGPVPTAEGIAAHKVAGQGSGFVEYHLRIPDAIPLDKIESMVVLAELASRAGDKKLDWPKRKKVFDYPQTDVKKWPSDVVLKLNGQLINRHTIADDPADARGTLSHHRGYQGSYGQLVEGPVAAAAMRALLADLREERTLRVRWEVPADAEHPGGLAVFGDQLGCYPVSPTVVLSFEGGHGLGDRYASEQPVAVDRILAGQ